MENNNLMRNLTGLLSSKEPSTILKHLIDIRKQVDWPKNKDNVTYLRKDTNLKTILDKLAISKRSIIDVILSILGNCCLDAKCSRDLVVRFNILSNINQIMKRYPKEDSINGRIFRIIGNICAHKDQWSSCIIEKKPQIVWQIVQFLKDSCTSTTTDNGDGNDDNNNKTTDATIIMGIRALRELLNRETLKLLMDKYQVMNTIGMLLIKYSKLYETKKNKEIVLINLIKLILKYSSYRYYPIICQLKNTENGDAIMYLPKILSITPKQIVKIVMNFLTVIHRISELPFNEIFNYFCTILSRDGVIEEFNQTTEESLRCLCKLLEHPTNRNIKRCGNTVTLLVDILRKLSLIDNDNDNNKKIECCILIITTLNRCKYEQESLLEQIKADVIDVLAKKLIWVVGGVEQLKVNHICDRKRKPEKMFEFNFLLDDGSSSNDNNSSDNSDIDDYFKMKKDKNSSPVYIDSDTELAMSYTSGLSPIPSPQRLQNYQLSESDSDDYSPICSDVDDHDVVMITPPEIADDDIECCSDIQQINDDSCGDNQILSDTIMNDSMVPHQPKITGNKMKLLVEIVKLLKTYTKLRPVVLPLANSELLLCLIKSTNFCDWSLQIVDDIFHLIDRILLLNDYLLPLMETNFVQLIQDMSYIQHDSSCIRCRHLKSLSQLIIQKLSIVAESGVGRGDIAYKLLRGDLKIKQTLVVVLPYIILTKSILIKFMLNCGGLDVLMRLLRDDNEIKDRTIKAVCLMADKRLRIVNPIKIKNYKKTPTTDLTVEATVPSSSQLVSFKLDDGSVLQANRKLLSDASDYFQSLLNGNFRESKEDEIELHNVINKSFKYLLNLIECKIIDRDPPVNIDIDLVTHLDVIILCDRFLMQNYCLYLSYCIEKYRFKSTTIPLIYQWSVESRTNMLRVECIAYALVAKMLDTERIEMFKCLFDVGYTDELIGDIRALLVRHMNVNPFEAKRKRAKRYFR